MALWGTKDTVYSTGNVNVNVTTGVVTKQSGSIAWTSGNGVKVGQVITIDGSSEGIIESIDSATQLTIGTEYLPSANISNKGYEIREIPKSTLHDTKFAVGEIFGVDTTENQLQMQPQVMHVSLHHHMQVGLVLHHTLICMVI